MSFNEEEEEEVVKPTGFSWFGFLLLQNDKSEGKNVATSWNVYMVQFCFNTQLIVHLYCTHVQKVDYFFLLSIFLFCQNRSFICGTGKHHTGRIWHLKLAESLPTDWLSSALLQLHVIFGLTSSPCSLSTAKQAEARDDPVLHGAAADAPEAALQHHGRHQAGDRGGQEEHELVRYDLSDAPQAQSNTIMLSLACTSLPSAGWPRTWTWGWWCSSTLAKMCPKPSTWALMLSYK